MCAHAEPPPASGPVFRHACGICPMQEWCWPPGLGESDLKRLHSIVRHTSPVPEGHHLFRAGDPFTAIYAVRSGCVKSYVTDLQGREYVCDFHLPGEVLGFDAVFPECHHFNALILHDALLCIIPYRDIEKLSRQIPGLQARILTIMSRAFSHQQVCADGADATQQVAIFLFDIDARLARQVISDYEFDLPMSHENIAHYLRISPETFSRVISKLQQAGIIKANRKHIHLLDIARLELIARGDHLEQKSALD